MSKITALPGLSPERLQELADVGVDVTASFDGLALPEPQYGEQTIGNLTEDEARLFVAFFNAQAELEDMHRNTMGAILRRAGDQIAKSDRSKNLGAALQGTKLAEFDNEADEKSFCRMQMLVDYLRNALFFQIAERLDCHSFKIGVRSKRRIVKTGRRIEGMIDAQ